MLMYLKRLAVNVCLMSLSASVFAVPADLDDDGIPTHVENTLGLNPNDASDAALDLDGDGWSNLDEYHIGTGIDDINDHPGLVAHRHQKVFASDGASNDRFGYAVAASQTTLVIGAINDSFEGGSRSGSTYIYERNDANLWTEVTKLTASDSNAYENFGSSAAISGNLVVIGAQRDHEKENSAGAAYVYERDDSGGWTEIIKLTASDAAKHDWFGNSVAVAGNTVLVGAHLDDNNRGNNAGAAYIYEKRLEGWVELSKLTASDGDVTDGFGISVSMTHEFMVIGASLDDDNGLYSGSAYVFERNENEAWVQVAKLLASDGSDQDRFGYSVAISKETVIIGAYGSNSAYVYDRDSQGNWSETTKLTAGDGVVNDAFGQSVSISNDTVIVGASNDDDDGTSSGSVYIYQRDEVGDWTESIKLTANDGNEGDYFGGSVSVVGGLLVAGAMHDDDALPDSGTAYVYEIPTITDTDNDSVFDLTDNCLHTPNPDQLDTNIDGYGDACAHHTATLGDNVTLLSGAYVNQRSTIGPKVKIGVNSQVGNVVTIGALSTVGSETTIYRSVTVGESVTVGNQVSISQRTQIGDRSRIGHHVVVGGDVVMGSDVQLSDRSSVGSGIQLPANSVLGERTRINPNVSIQGQIQLGANNKVYQGASLGSGVTIGDDAIIAGQVGGLSVLGDNIRIKQGTTVGTQVNIASDAVIGDNVVIGDQVQLASQSALAGGTNLPANSVLNEGASISPNTTLVGALTLGAGSKVYGGGIVGANVTVGSASIIAGQVDDDVVIGNTVRILSNAVIETGAVVGDNVQIRQGARVLANSTVPDGTILRQNEVFGP